MKGGRDRSERRHGKGSLSPQEDADELIKFHAFSVTWLSRDISRMTGVRPDSEPNPAWPSPAPRPPAQPSRPEGYCSSPAALRNVLTRTAPPKQGETFEYEMRGLHLEAMCGTLRNSRERFLENPP